MTQNNTLHFRNQIQFEVFAECNTSVIVKIDDVEYFKRNYKANVLYTENLDFYHDYNDGGRSYLEFFFTGEREVATKYLKVNSIYINNTYTSNLGHYYYPDINPEWWNSLTPEQQKEVNHNIHINNGGHFGWYGRIKYEMRTAMDTNSHYIHSTDPAWSRDRIIGRSNTMNVVYENKANNRAPWNQKRDSS
jgi:hypothetical protein